jgi:penicillin-binding protein 2
VTEGNRQLRLTVIGGIIAALFFGLFARLWFLQVASSSSYAAETQANRTRVVTDPGARGSILDGRGTVVVENRLITSIEIQRGLPLSELTVTVKNLATLLNTTQAALWKQVHNPRLTAYEPIPIRQDLPYDTLVSIKERPESYPGVIATQRSVRVYPYASPYGDLAPHLLGYVGSVNAHDAKVHPGERYTPEDVIGKDGIEQVFEHELRGTPHVRKLEVDSRGRIVQVLSDVPATTGNDVQLTMDSVVQQETQTALKQGITEVQGMRDQNFKNSLRNFAGSGGSAVVLDARNGSVLALASWPTYQVSKFTSGIPLDQYQALADPAQHYPLLDRATQGLYPPGSTFKLFTAIAALENGAAVPNTASYTFNDNGCVKFGATGNEQQFCNADKTPHGIVDLAHAIEVSSDVYFYNLGFRFFGLWNCGVPATCPQGATKQADKVKGYGVQNVAKEFGFGRPTGVGLPQESFGRIPDLDYKIKVNETNPDPYSRTWLPGDSANVAVGQGDVLSTPIQLASAYAAFINGGTLYSPRLASRIYAPDGRTVVRDLPPQEVRKIPIDPQVRALIMPGLIGAVNAKDGTASPAFSGYHGLPVAGKTGTAQQPPPTEDTSWFVGLVNPVPNSPTDPQYVVVVNVEQAGFGGTVAAPIARRIIDTLNGNPNPAPVEIAPHQTD